MSTPPTRQQTPLNEPKQATAILDLDAQTQHIRQEPGDYPGKTLSYITKGKLTLSQERTTDGETLHVHFLFLTSLLNNPSIHQANVSFLKMSQTNQGKKNTAQDIVSGTLAVNSVLNTLKIGLWELRPRIRGVLDVLFLPTFLIDYVVHFFGALLMYTSNLVGALSIDLANKLLEWSKDRSVPEKILVFIPVALAWVVSQAFFTTGNVFGFLVNLIDTIHNLLTSTSNTVINSVINLFTPSVKIQENGDTEEKLADRTYPKIGSILKKNFSKSGYYIWPSLLASLAVGLTIGFPPAGIGIALAAVLTYVVTAVLIPVSINTVGQTGPAKSMGKLMNRILNFHFKKTSIELNLKNQDKYQKVVVHDPLSTSSTSNSASGKTAKTNGPSTPVTKTSGKPIASQNNAKNNNPKGNAKP